MPVFELGQNSFAAVTDLVRMKQKIMKNVGEKEIEEEVEDDDNEEKNTEFGSTES